MKNSSDHQPACRSMSRSRASMLSRQIISTVVPGLVATGVLASVAYAGEVMTERCSAAVAIVPSYGANPDAPGTVVIKRPGSGSTGWTTPIRVQAGRDGHIRWWCNSTIGNFFDLGTWRPQVDVASVPKCAGEVIDGKYTCIAKLVKPHPGASARNGWTPERSRCDDRSTLVRARLGPNRLLNIECLGR